MNNQAMTAEQIEAVNAACQMIMDATNCTSAEAMEQLTSLFEDMDGLMSCDNCAIYLIDTV